MQVLGIFRRLANSLFMEWRSRQTKPQFLTTSDFAVDMAAEGHRRAMILVTAMNPSFTRAHESLDQRIIAPSQTG